MMVLGALAGIVGGIAILSAIPLVVALVRSRRARVPPERRRARFWGTFLVALAIEVALIVIGVGVCFVIVSNAGVMGDP